MGACRGALRTARDLAQRLGVSQVVARDRVLAVPGRACSGRRSPATAIPTTRTRCARLGGWGRRPRPGERLGYPYEEAHALADADDPDLLAAALDVADGLGAAPLAARLRARMRAVGVRGCPAVRSRLPGPTRRALPPASSTCWSCSGEGLTDAEIAQRLVLSVKTVNHHVAAVLGKLGVSNRRAAARAAARLR